VLSISEIRIGPRSDRKPTLDDEAADAEAGVAMTHSLSRADLAEADVADRRFSFPG
jgi:hypothetical protein